MERIMIALIVSLTLVIPALAEEAGGEVEKKGEIVDLHCHLERGASGPDHAGCAAACISRGVPAALLTDDGELYLLLDEGRVSLAPRLEGKIGKPVTVRGVEVEKGGLRAIRVSGVE